jgi:hypothetical protein
VRTDPLYVLLYVVVFILLVYVVLRVTGTG